MSNKTMVADVDMFVGKTLDQMARVAKASIQDVLIEAQAPVAKGGKMPVDTGALRNSLIVRINSAEKARGNKSAGKESETSIDAIRVAITGYELGDVVQFEWSAEYARIRHYMVGVGQGGGLWRDAAAQKWPEFVKANVAKVQ